MVTLDQIYSVMVNYYHRTFRESTSRIPDVTDKKAMFALIASHYGHKHCDIQEYMGWKSHASVCHATKVMRGYIDVYPALQREFVEILRRVKQAAHTVFLEIDSTV